MPASAHIAQNVQNGGQNGIQNGGQNGIQNGGHNGIQNGGRNGGQNGIQNRIRKTVQHGLAPLEKIRFIYDHVGREREMTEDVFDVTYREKEGPKPPRQYVWRNIFLIGFLHVATLYSLTVLPVAKFLTLGWVLVCFILSGLGITAGAHRLWCHRTYKASLPLRIFLCIFNTMAFQNDIYEWSRDHRVHHKFSETDADPHNARRGFFFSHVGWLLVRKHPDVIEKGKTLDMSDLAADKVVMFQRKVYKVAVVIMCFVIPSAVPWILWRELLINSILLTILRYTVVLNATWLVNSAAHLYGSRPYDKTINPRENRFVVLGALGEGFHNYHHTFPYDYSTSEFGWHWNFTTGFIDLMCYLGLASDLKKAAKQTVMARKQRTGERRPMISGRSLEASNGNPKTSNGSLKVSDGNDKASDGSHKASDGSHKMSNGSLKVSDGSHKASDECHKASNGISKINDGNDKASDETHKASNGTPKISNGNPNISDGSDKASDESHKASNGNPKISNGNPNISDENDKASDENHKISHRGPRIGDGSHKASDESYKASDGSHKLSNGSQKTIDGSDKTS